MMMVAHLSVQRINVILLRVIARVSTFINAAAKLPFNLVQQLPEFVTGMFLCLCVPTPMRLLLVMKVVTKIHVSAFPPPVFGLLPIILRAVAQLPHVVVSQTSIVAAMREIHRLKHPIVVGSILATKILDFALPYLELRQVDFFLFQNLFCPFFIMFFSKLNYLVGITFWGWNSQRICSFSFDNVFSFFLFSVSSSVSFLFSCFGTVKRFLLAFFFWILFIIGASPLD